MQDLFAALCLVLVLEGLMAFAAPDAWKRMLAQLIETDSRVLRRVGAAMVVAGLVLLQLLRGS